CCAAFSVAAASARTSLSSSYGCSSITVSDSAPNERTIASSDLPNRRSQVFTIRALQPFPHFTVHLRLRRKGNLQSHCFVKIRSDQASDRPLSVETKAKIHSRFARSLDMRKRAARREERHERLAGLKNHVAA